MAKRSAARAQVAADQGTQIGVAAEFLVADIRIPISAADLTRIKENGLQFSLPPGEVVEVPSLEAFFNHLAEQLGVGSLSVPSEDQLRDTPFGKLFSTPLRITRLSLNTKSGDFSIAIGFYPDPPVPFMNHGPLSNIKLKSLAFSLNRSGE